MHLYCLFPFFPLPVSFRLRDLLLHFTQPTSSSAPGPSEVTCSAHTPGHKHVGRSVYGSLCRCLTCCRQEGHRCLQHVDCKSPISLEGCQLPSRLEQEGRYRIGCAATPPPFSPSSSFLPSPLLWHREQLLSASKVYHSTGLWEQVELQQKVMQNRHKTSGQELACTDLSFALTWQ